MRMKDTQPHTSFSLRIEDPGRVTYEGYHFTGKNVCLLAPVKFGTNLWRFAILAAQEVVWQAP